LIRIADTLSTPKNIALLVIKSVLIKVVVSMRMDIVVLENMTPDENDFLADMRHRFALQGIDIDEVMKLPPEEMFARLGVKESFGGDPRVMSGDEADRIRRQWLKEH
jgi:hypothetical protein